MKAKGETHQIRIRIVATQTTDKHVDPGDAQTESTGSSRIIIQKTRVQGDSRAGEERSCDRWKQGRIGQQDEPEKGTQVEGPSRKEEVSVYRQSEEGRGVSSADVGASCIRAR